VQVSLASFPKLPSQRPVYCSTQRRVAFYNTIPINVEKPSQPVQVVANEVHTIERVCSVSSQTVCECPNMIPDFTSGWVSHDHVKTNRQYLL
jgi:hypothetical protein